MEFQGQLTKQEQLHHTAVSIVVAISLMVAGDCVTAVSSTAYAEVTVRIIPQLTPIDALMVYPQTLDLNQQNNAELAITNQAAAEREIHLKLAPLPANLSACSIHYSPSSFTLQSSATQVVRIMKTMERGHTCSVNLALVVSDANRPTIPLFEIPLGNATQ